MRGQQPEPEAETVLGALLLKRLKSIKEGEIAATAKAAGVADRYLRELRQKDSLNVTILTLEKLLRGLGITPAELVEDAPEAEQPVMRKRATERVRAKLERAAVAADSLGELLRQLGIEMEKE